MPGFTDNAHTLPSFSPHSPQSRIHDAARAFADSDGGGGLTDDADVGRAHKVSDVGRERVGFLHADGPA